jgi:hypothetical protein
MLMQALSSIVMPPVALRPAQATDLAFCRRITHETMRWIVAATKWVTSWVGSVQGPYLTLPYPVGTADYNCST